MDGAAQSRPALLLPGYGDRCGKCWYCSPETPCYCCLQAEVEALRARNETLIATIQRQDSTFERQMEEHEELEALRAQVQADEEAERSLRERYNDLLVDHGKLTAQVQRVREACEPFGPMGSIAVWRILNALDGDNDA